MNKILKSAICVAVSASLVTPVVYFASHKKSVKAAENPSAKITTVAETTTQTTTQTTVTETTVAETTAEATTTAQTNSLVAAQKTLATAAAKREVIKPSQLVANGKCVESWDVSSNGMRAHVEKLKVDLSQYERGPATTTYRYMYLAKITGPQTGFKTAAASQATGQKVDTVTNMAKKMGAVFAVNGEMCDHKLENYHGFLNGWGDTATATVIKNSAVPQAVSASPSLTMDKNGNWEYPVIVTPENAQSLINDGIISTISYTYPVIWRGERYITEGGVAPMWYERDTKESIPSKHFYNAHTLIGQINTNSYVVAISEGFGRGYLCDTMEAMGVQNAFWANGGHCSVMYIKGVGAINRLDDHQLCKAADMMYF